MNMTDRDQLLAERNAWREQAVELETKVEVLREAIEGVLSAYDDDRLFGDDPIEVSIARAVLDGNK